MDEKLIDEVTKMVMNELNNINVPNKIPVGISSRHIHLSEEDVEKLFGKGYKLKPMKDLSQKGQYACEECLDLVTEKGVIEKVRVLGPTRPNTQVEIALTDARKLGIAPPIRPSGKIDDTPGIILKYKTKKVPINKGVIVAEAHVHMNEEDAKQFNVKDNDKINLRYQGKRSGVFENVVVRVHPSFTLDFHVDTDEGNAFAMSNKDYVEVVK